MPLPELANILANITIEMALPWALLALAAVAVLLLVRSAARQRQAMQQGLLSDRLAQLERQLLEDNNRLEKNLREALATGRLAQQRETADQKQTIEQALNRYRESLEKNQREALKAQQETLATTMGALSNELGKRVESLTKTTDERLREISGQVDKRLHQGFEKTTETFTRVLEHLTRIDEAQKKITELSGNVVSLQEVLTDKRSRGAFGEVQLEGLVRNLMPEDSFDMQATLSNGKRVDCLLRLPDPTGNVPIDAKFPLESYQRMMDVELAADGRTQAASQFRKDIRKHIQDIAGKYLIPGETADGAVMFIPAEAIFAEIHAHYPELVEEAQHARVWMVSPTTLMAVLSTARAVLKDDATRKQVHVIQDHLRKLSADFGRFRQRMDKLATHIRQANDDVGQVSTSADKIVKHFSRIEEAQLDALPGDESH
jgi:DNA recombination protein RmuC